MKTKDSLFLVLQARRSSRTLVVPTVAVGSLLTHTVECLQHCKYTQSHSQGQLLHVGSCGPQVQKFYLVQLKLIFHMCSSSPASTLNPVLFTSSFLCLKYLEQFLFSGLKKKKKKLNRKKQKLALFFGAIRSKNKWCIQTPCPV